MRSAKLHRLQRTQLLAQHCFQLLIGRGVHKVAQQRLFLVHLSVIVLVLEILNGKAAEIIQRPIAR